MFRLSTADCISTDRTVETIRSFPVQYLYEKRRGVSYARNRGIEASRGEILVFTGPNCVVSTVWLNELVNVFDEQDVGGVAGAIIPYPGQTSVERYAARIRSHTQERPMSHPLRPFAMTPNIAFRREVFQQIGCFDTRFPGGGWEDADLCWRFFRETNLKLKYAPRAVVFHRYRATANAAFRKEALLRTGGFDSHCDTGEDIDLSIRVAKAGYELWFEPSAKITHFHRYTLKGLLKQWFNYGYGHAYLYKKHSNKRRLEFYRYDLSSNNDNPFGIARVLTVPFPIYGMVFLSSYHLMHFALIVAFISFLFSFPKLGVVAFVASFLAAAWYFGIRFDSKRPLKSILFSGIRYVADGAYVLGGFLGGIREGVIYLEATRTRKHV